MKTHPRIVRSLLALSLCAGFVTATAPYAQAQPPTAALKIVLVGDSYTAGNGARTSGGDRNYYGPEDCFRSRSNWGEQWAKSLSVPTAVFNYACSGAISPELSREGGSGGRDDFVSAEISGRITAPTGSQVTEAYIRTRIEQIHPCQTTKALGVSRTLVGADTVQDHNHAIVNGTPLIFSLFERNIYDYRVKCVTHYFPQLNGVDSTADVVMVSVGGNDIGFANIVMDCFIQRIAPFHMGYDSDLCQSHVGVDGQGAELTREIDQTFGVQGPVETALSLALAKMRDGAPLVYMGYAGLEYDRNLSVPIYKWLNNGGPGAHSSFQLDHMLLIGPTIQRLQDHLEEVQRAMVARLNQNSERVYFVPLRSKFCGHENVAYPGIRANLPVPSCSDATGTEPWLWDAIEDTAPLFPDPASRGGFDFADASSFMAEYYHYKPAGHATLAGAIKSTWPNLPLNPTWHPSTGIIPGGAVTPPIAVPLGGRCSVIPLGLINFNDLQIAVTLSSGASLPFNYAESCVIFPDNFNGTYSLTISSQQSGFTWNDSFPIAVTDDGDDTPAEIDNCPLMANPSQADADTDGIGDACDPTPWPDYSDWPTQRGFGEPHLTTLDGRAYDLQSVGEFTLLSVPARGVTVQARFAPAAGSTSVALISDVAIGVPGGVVRATLGGDGVAVATVNGVEIPPSRQSSIAIGQTFVFWQDSRLIVQTSRGVVVAVGGSYSVGIDVAPGVPTLGLLGNHDGNASNDLSAADGTAVPLGDTSALHSWFADSWRVTDASSLFAYGAGLSTASYTDKSFPSNVTKLSDFSQSELEVANGKCIAAGVRSGVPMEACALDILALADDSFAAAAAAEPAGSIDPTSVRFDANGVLEQTFDGGVGQNMAGKSYVQVTSIAKAVGPLFSDSPFGFALVSVPRHDGATISSRIVVLGATVGDPGTGSLVVTVDATGAELSLSGDGSVLSGPAGTTIVMDGSGFTPAGMPYQAYRVTIPIGHFGDAMKVTYAPKNINAINGIGLGIDDVRISLQTSPSQLKTALELPFIAGSAQGTGFGMLETPGAADEYRFTLGATSSDVLVEMGTAGPVRIDLVNITTGLLVNTFERTSYHFLWRALPPGAYSVLVTGMGQATDYSFAVMEAPAAQEFSFEIGQSIGDGTLGGVATPGAGRLETTASLDVYRFLVSPAQDGETVIFETGGVLPTCRSARLMTGHVGGYSLGNPCTTTGFRLEATLSSGEYRVEVPIDPITLADAYSMFSYVKPPAQVFSYSMGQSISGGFVGGAPVPGAGTLETPASVDVYAFTISPADAGKTWVFPGQSIMTECRDAQLYPGISGGVSLGPVCVTATTKEYTLPAGDYRIEVPSYNSGTGTYSLYPYEKRPADVFDYQLGQTVDDQVIGGVTVPGAGRLETDTSMDVYRFTVTDDQAGKTWVFDAIGNGIWPRCTDSRLMPGVSGGSSLGSICGHLEVTLPAGDYRIEVPAGGNGAGAYTFTSVEKPAPQVFPYVLGQTVDNGLVGGVAAAGAGNLELSTSMDVYRFTVSAGQVGTWVFDGIGNGLWPRCTDSRLMPGLTGGSSLGSVCGHLEVTLAAGDYRIEVPVGGNGTGTYSYASYFKPAPEVFAYQIGQSVSNGLVGGVAAPGAGNIETSTSLDVYTFTVTPAQAASLVVFDGGGGIWPICTWSRILPVGGSTSLGGICGHVELRLSAGDYRIEVPMGSNGTGTYQFTSSLRALPQEFAYTLGQSVADGTVGGVATTGAGNIEVGSLGDIYRFTVSAAQASQTWVFDGSGTGCSTSALLYPGASGGTAIGTVCGHLETVLAAGDYRIEFPATPTGTYTFSSAEKPQTFAYSLGQVIADGTINGTATAGAGNLETVLSKDVYTFTVTAGQASSTWVFDGSGVGCSAAAKIYPGATGGTTVGSVCGHLETTLTPGTWRVEVPASATVSGAYTISSAVKPLPQEFTYGLGQTVTNGTIGGVATTGAGNVETGSSGDIYRFTVSAAQAPQSWVFDGSGTACSTGALLYPGTTGGTAIGSVCGHLEASLAAGSYRVVFPESPTGTYTFTSAEKPQSFTYSLGQTVAAGTIGGVATTGAGNLETALSKDVYTFTVSAAQAPQTWVFDGSGAGCSTAAQLYPGTSGGTAIGTVCGHLEITLAAGTWRIEVPASATVSGSYTFTSAEKPQSFAYSLGQVLATGSIGGVATTGAGTLETPLSKDVYTFTVSATQATRTWVFDGSGAGCSTAAKIYPGTTGGTAVGSVCGHLETTLAAGTWRIEVPASATVTGAYTFTTAEKPQAFTYSLGQTIANGTIGGVATTGAGNLETALSKDVYTITVTAAQAASTWEFDGSGVGCSVGAQLFPGATGGTAVGSVCGHLEKVLTAGTWRIEVPASMTVTGAYTIGSYAKPAAQSFTYTLGQAIANGTIGGVAKTGAGNLETGASSDVYQITVTSAQAGVWRFTGSNTAVCASAALYPGTTGGTSLGSVCNTLDVALTAGSYRIEVPAANNTAGTYTLSSVKVPPVVGVTPTITGTAQVGQVLTGVAGTWTPAPVTLAYQWLRNGTAISGATASTYTVTTADIRASLSVTVTGTKAGYVTTSLTSGVTAAVSLPGGIEPVTTTRIVDTSTGLGATKAAVAKNADLTVTVTGVGGIPTGAKAVLVSITGTSSAAGTLTAYTAGTTLPAITTLQMRATEVSTATVLVAASSAGKISIRNASTGTTQIQVDVLGYVIAGTSTTAGVVTPVTPVRISAAAALAASATRAVQVTGANGVPTGAGAAVVNVTVTSPAVAGGVKVYASGGTVPTNSQIRFGVSRAVTSQVIVPIGSDGKIVVANTTTGTMTVAVDLIGYVTGGTVVAGQTSVSLAAPARVADSSTSLAITGPVAAGATVTIPVTGASGVPAGAKGAWVTLTVTGPTAVGSLITWASGTTAPTATHLRFVASQPATIVVYAQLAADGTMKIKNTSTGTIQLAVDVAGYTS